MIRGAAWLLAELIGLFFGVAFAIHLLQRFLGTTRLRSWMGGTPLVSALKGIAIGFVTPFCTYSAIPMLVGLRQAGVPPAGYVAFIAAAPVLDPVLFGALVVIVGVEAAVTYSLVAFGAAVTLAMTAQRIGIERQLKPIPSVVGADVGGSLVSPTAGHPDREPPSASCGPAEDLPWRGARAEVAPAAWAAGALLKSVAPLPFVGIGIGLAIEAIVSPDVVTTVTGNNGPWAIPVAAALGTPLYVHTSVLVPIANSLTNAGVGIGAIVALTISGAGANVPEFIILTKLADRRLIAGFFAYVFSVALIGGLLAQVILN